MTRLAICVFGLFLAVDLGCQRGKAFYPVKGQAFVDGKPAAGVTIVFHPLESTDPPLLPSAIVALAARRPCA